MDALAQRLQHAVLARHDALATEDSEADGNRRHARERTDLVKRELRREPQPRRAGLLERRDTARVVHGDAGADLGGRAALDGEGELGDIAHGHGLAGARPRVQARVVALATDLVEPGNHALGPGALGELVCRRVDARRACGEG